MAPRSMALFVLLFDHPSLEVGRNDVAAADDRHDPFAPIAGPVLQYRRNAKGGRRLHDESRVAIKHPHSGNDALFLNQRDMVGHGQKVAENRRDRRRPATHPRSCRCGRSRRQILPATTTPSPARRSAARKRSRPRGRGLEDIADARRHGAAPERNDHGVYRTHVLDELDPDRPCAFAGIEIFAVLDQKRAFDVSHPPRQMASVLKSPSTIRTVAPNARIRSSLTGWRWRQPRP